MTCSLDNIRTAVWIYDIDQYRIYWANTAALRLWESESLKELSSRDFGLDMSGAAEQALRGYKEIFSQGESFSTIWRITPKNIQKEVFCQFSGYILPDDTTGMLVEAIPIEMVNRHTNMTSAIQLASFHLNGDFLGANPAFIETIGAEPATLKELFCDKHQYNKLFDTLCSYDPPIDFIHDVLLNTSSGQKWFLVNATRSSDVTGNPTILIHQYDIHHRKVNEIALKEELLRDVLTGLLNRKGFSFATDEIIRNSGELVIFCVDLDGFKLINDSFGHATGDQILIAFAKVLKEFYNEKGFAARIGGDEFTWAIDRKLLESSVKNTADLLMQSIKNITSVLNRSPIIISASIGVAESPNDGRTLEKLLVAADTAMYRAKSQGRRRWVRYEASMAISVNRKTQLVQRIYSAIDNHEISLFYQPIVNVLSGDVIAFEALLRWKNPDLGWVPAQEAIQVAEDMGFIVELENWIIGQSIADLTKLRECVPNDPRIAINISALHLNDETFIETIEHGLEKNGHNYKDLSIELTESVLFEGMGDKNNPVKKLFDLGVEICIDDFGTGYSSLSYLHRIPASLVKIDRSFVETAEQNPASLKCIIQLILSLGMTPLIEGVQTREQRDLLKKIGINLHQGFYYSKPKPINALQKSKP